MLVEVDTDDRNYSSIGRDEDSSLDTIRAAVVVKENGSTSPHQFGEATDSVSEHVDCARNLEPVVECDQLEGRFLVTRT